MQDSHSQDRLAGTLSYIIFFVPLMMDHRTEFACFHMRQAFLLNVVAILASIIPFFGGIISFFVFIHVVFLMWKAYHGEKLAIPYIYPYAEKLITVLSLQKWFVPTK